MTRTARLILAAAGALALALTAFFAACGDGPGTPGETPGATRTPTTAGTPRPTLAQPTIPLTGPTPRLGGNVTKVSPAHGAVLSTVADGAHDRPHLAVHHDLRADEAVVERVGDALPLIRGGVLVLAEAVAQHATEHGLAAAVAQRAAALPLFRHVRGIGRPDDVQPWPQCHLADDMSRLTPDDEAAHPQARLGRTGGRADLVARPRDEFKLLWHPNSDGLPQAGTRTACQPRDAP